MNEQANWAEPEITAAKIDETQNPSNHEASIWMSLEAWEPTSFSGKSATDSDEQFVFTALDMDMNQSRSTIPEYHDPANLIGQR